MPWRSRWSGARLSSTAPSGANSTASSSWKEETSQTTVASGARWPTSELSAVPTLPATATGRPASRWMWPMSSVVVVLPLVPVTAMNSLGISRHASSTSPSTGSPRSRAAAMTGACAGTPGDLTTARTCSSAAGVSSPWRRSTPRACSPRGRSTSSAATPERARPTTSHGPGGSGGRRGWRRCSWRGQAWQGRRRPLRWRRRRGEAESPRERSTGGSQRATAPPSEWAGTARGRAASHAMRSAARAPDRRPLPSLGDAVWRRARRNATRDDRARSPTAGTR